MKKTIFLLAFITSYQCHALFTEFGLSGSFRKNTIDKNNYTKTVSISGSISLYFGALNALEFGYTQARSTQVTTRTNTSGELDPHEKVVALLDILTTDFVVNFADRQAPVQPYIKAGAAYFLKKRYELSTEDFPTVTVIEKSPGIGPSAGAGVKIALPKGFRLKLSFNWRGAPPEDNKINSDYSGRIGLTWLM